MSSLASCSYLGHAIWEYLCRCMHDKTHIWPQHACSKCHRRDQRVIMSLYLRIKESAQVWIVNEYSGVNDRLPSAGSCYSVKGHKQQSDLLEGMQTRSSRWSAVHVCFGQTLTGWHNKHRALMEHWETEKHATWPNSPPLTLFQPLGLRMDRGVRFSELCVVHIHTEKYYSFICWGGGGWQHHYIKYYNLWYQ